MLFFFFFFCLTQFEFISIVHQKLKKKIGGRIIILTTAGETRQQSMIAVFLDLTALWGMLTSHEDLL